MVYEVVGSLILCSSLRLSGFYVLFTSLRLMGIQTCDDSFSHTEDAGIVSKIMEQG